MIMTMNNGMTAILVPAHVPGYDTEDLVGSLVSAAASAGARLKAQENDGVRLTLGFVPGGPDVETSLRRMAEMMGVAQ